MECNWNRFNWNPELVIESGCFSDKISVRIPVRILEEVWYCMKNSDQISWKKPNRGHIWYLFGVFQLVWSENCKQTASEFFKKFRWNTGRKSTYFLSYFYQKNQIFLLRKWFIGLIVTFWFKKLNFQSDIAHLVGSRLESLTLFGRSVKFTGL